MVAGAGRIDMSVQDAGELYRGFLDHLFSSAVTDTGRVP
jgi:hypothetical protein